MKTKRVMAILLMAIAIMSLLAACGGEDDGDSGGGLSGTYVHADGDSYTFNGSNYTYKLGEELGSGLEEGDIEKGSYRIKDDRIAMIPEVNYKGDFDELLSSSFSKEGNSIFIDGDEYKKK